MAKLEISDWKIILLACLIAVVGSSPALSPDGHVSPVPTGRTCDNLRRDMALLFEQVYDKVPTLLTTMLSTVQDYNLGKSPSLNAATMKAMIVNSFISLIPACDQPQGKGTIDLVKPSEPSGGYLFKPHRVPRVRYHLKGNTHRRVMDAETAGQVRRKRSSSSSDAKISSDHLIIGDAYIPLDAFQHQGGNEEEEQNQITLELYV